MGDKLWKYVCCMDLVMSDMLQMTLREYAMIYKDSYLHILLWDWVARVHANAERCMTYSETSLQL